MVILGISILVLLTACTTSQSVSTDTGSSEATTESADIIIENFAFTPETIIIQSGDTITWRNDDSVSHTVTSDEGSELDSGFLSSGDTYVHTFNTPGTYTYHCTPHPSMTATIIVE